MYNIGRMPGFEPEVLRHTSQLAIVLHCLSGQDAAAGGGAGQHHVHRSAQHQDKTQPQGSQRQGIADKKGVTGTRDLTTFNSPSAVCLQRLLMRSSGITSAVLRIRILL